MARRSGVRPHARRPVYVNDVAAGLGIHEAFASRLLAQAVLAGKVRKLGHQKGWTAVE